jgi:hypothetical protein
MNSRDEIKALWDEIGRLNARVNATRQSIVPATDPTQFSWFDHFSDASINDWYKQINNAAGKTITEPGGSNLVFTITAGVDARWTLGTNNLAPHICIGNPGFPYIIETKICAGSTMPAAETQAGIWVGSGEGASANQTIMFGYSGAGYWYYDGASGNARGPVGFPAYLRMHISGQPSGSGYRISAYYSSDGVVWTQYENVLGVPWYWWTSTFYSYNCGLFVRNWGAFPASIINFDYLRNTRQFGPGGS